MRFMILPSSFVELMEDQILLYYLIVLNINDRAYIYIYIYIYIVVSVTLGFMFYAFVRRLRKA